MSKPSVDVLYESLQPYMVGTFGGKTERERALLDEANERLLGKPPVLMCESEQYGDTVEEATGLHKYGDNHLKEEFDLIDEGRQEALDLIVITGPFAKQRLALSLEKWGPLKTRYMNVAVKFFMKGLEALAAAEALKE